MVEFHLLSVKEFNAAVMFCDISEDYFLDAAKKCFYGKCKSVISTRPKNVLKLPQTLYGWEDEV